MINELYTLAKCLKRCDIQGGKLCQDVKRPGKSEGFIVEINKDGMPQNIKYVDGKDMAKLWTLRKGNHNSFPFVKLKRPIWHISLNDSIWEELKKLKRKPAEKRIKLQGINSNQEVNKQDIYLADWTKERINCIRDKDEKISALVNLVDRFSIIDKSQREFFEKLSELILNGVNEQTVDLAAIILVGDKKEGKKKIVCDIPLFFDISDWNKYCYRVADPEMGVLVGKCLSQESSDMESTVGMCALEGIVKLLHSGPYPDINLPAIGRTYLFSMNEDAECHRHYGKISSSIFPASRDAVKAMHSALEWSVDESRKGKTWQRIPNIKRKQDLVIAYLEEMPEPPAELASCISEFDSKESEMKEADYEERASAVCKALEGEKGLNKNSKVNILVLTKVDEGRGQIVLSEMYTVGNIIESIKQWQIASKNHPHFSVLLPGKKGEKTDPVEPFCPSPTEVIRCLQNQWVRNGFDKCDVPGIALRHVYDLFLGREHLSQESARMTLSLMLQRLRQLLIGFATADDARNIKGDLPEARRTVLVGISVLAIILYKFGIKKEDYMKNPAFYIGKLLAFADGLHAQYCKLQMKRKGDLPPQLIGNAVLPVAFENPNRALALLGDRLRIYYAWGTKVQGDEYKLVKWMMSEIGKISAELENVSFPSMADDAVKAQVLLGYLARSKSEE